MTLRESATAAMIAAIVLAWARPAAADEAPPTGTIYFARGGALFAQPAAGGDATPLPADHALPAVDALAVSADGHWLLASGGGSHRLYDLRRPSAPPRVIVCPHTVRLSADGNTALCDAGTGWLIEQDLGGIGRRVLVGDATGATPMAGGDVVLARSGALLRVGPRTREVAPDSPAGAWLPAPDGNRAVGVWTNGRHPEMFTFRLDGHAVRRRLLRDGVPVAWSADSKWVLAQRNKRACIVRAVGGEYKCWRRYRARAIAPDGSFALLERDGHDKGTVDLYRAQLDGADIARPVLLERNVGGAAAWAPNAH